MSDSPHEWHGDRRNFAQGPAVIMKTAMVILVGLTVAGCGAASAARESGKLFDKYGCLAREFKGEPPCKAPATPGETVAPN
jgi:hypothetical protein